MSTNHTEHYNLCQWEPDDAVLRTDFNADNAAIDKALNGKADASAVTELSKRVDGKADASVLAQLNQTVANHTSSLSGKGNCRIYTTSYTGTGTNGADHPNSLTFPARPAVVLIGERSDIGTTLIAFYGQTTIYTHNYTFSLVSVSWSGNTMTWFAGSSDTGQLNKRNLVYDVVALISL